MTQLMPQPTGTSLASKAGYVFGLNAPAGEGASLYFNATDAIAVDDSLRVTGNVIVFAGEPIRLRQGTHQIAELTEAGAFDIAYSAANTSTSFRIDSGLAEEGDGARHVMTLSIER